ncbi:contact-dependent growth inhibition system immunity protein [Asaia spathodeae]|nr:contact-dependent growth inhibition system immunity protein [Asaia spathodeae]
MSIVERRYLANIKMNEKFINVSTSSGYRSSIRDILGKDIYLSTDADQSDLGHAILSALGVSRFVLPERRTDGVTHPDLEYDMSLYDYKKSDERYKKWVAEAMEKFGYKTKKAMFKNMKSCEVEKDERSIIIIPWKHEKLEAWSLDGLSEGDNVVIPADSSAEEIGLAARLALSRCI